YRFLAFEGRPAEVDQLPVKRVRKAMVLLFLTRAGDRRIDRGLMENGGEIQTLRLPVVNGRLRLELVGAPDHLLELAEAERGHQFPHFLGDEEEIVHDVFWLAGELGP